MEQFLELFISKDACGSWSHSIKFYIYIYIYIHVLVIFSKSKLKWISFLTFISIFNRLWKIISLSLLKF